MPPLSKIRDWLTAEYDFSFVSNALERWFDWSRASADVRETDAQVLDAMRALGQLWTSTAYTATLAPFEDDVPSDDARDDIEVSVETPDPDALVDQLDAAVQAGIAKRAQSDDLLWAMTSVSPTGHGWARLAVPNASLPLDGAWILAGDDGWIPRPYVLRPAPPLEGLRTIWLTLADTSTSSDLSVFVNAAGSVATRLILGASVFNPALDPRSPMHLVHGAPLEAWQRANAALLERVSRRLIEAGWVQRHR